MKLKVGTNIVVNNINANAKVLGTLIVGNFEIKTIFIQ